jgi:hypothetical protein
MYKLLPYFCKSLLFLSRLMEQASYWLTLKAVRLEIYARKRLNGQFVSAHSKPNNKRGSL